MRAVERMFPSAALVLAGFALAFSAYLYTRVQNSRVATAEFSCAATNERHVETIEQLDFLIAQIPPGPRRTRAVDGRKSTVALLDAIVPFRKDCETYARKIVSKKK